MPRVSKPLASASLVVSSRMWRMNSARCPRNRRVCPHPDASDLVVEEDLRGGQAGRV